MRYRRVLIGKGRKVHALKRGFTLCGRGVGGFRPFLTAKSTNRKVDCQNCLRVLGR